MLDIQWSPSYKVYFGHTVKWRREWCIPQGMLGGFFQFWNANKVSLMADGFSISKSDSFITTTNTINNSQFLPIQVNQ